MSPHWERSPAAPLLGVCPFLPQIWLWEAGFVKALGVGPRRRGHPVCQETFVLCQQDERPACLLQPLPTVPSVCF